MATTIVQQSIGGNTGSSATPTLAYGSSVTLGNLLVAMIQWVDSTIALPDSLATITDTIGNSWTIIAGSHATNNDSNYSGASWHVQFAYCISKGSGANTVQFNFANVNSHQFSFQELDEVSGVDTLDVVKTGTGTGAAQITASGTTIGINEFCWSYIFIDYTAGGDTPTVGSGWTQQSEANPGTTSLFSIVQIKAAPGTIVGNSTTTVTTLAYAASLVTFMQGGADVVSMAGRFNVKM